MLKPPNNIEFSLEEIQEFTEFKKKHGLQYNKKTKKWNKEFFPDEKTRWITDKKVWNKELKKYGYYKQYTSGWHMGSISTAKCNYCGKLLVNRQTEFCSDPSHKKLFSKYIKEAKKKFNFTWKRDLLGMPTLYSYEIDEQGVWHETRTTVERIEKKNIKFVVNRKQFTLTTKSRTPKPKQKKKLSTIQSF